MSSFEDLGVPPEIAEALAAEGIESPTPLQEAAIPVVRKGNNLLIEAGPGAGVLIGWSVGLLERLEPGGDGPAGLVLCASRETADALAESTARVAAATDHRIAALGAAWVLPERADLLFAGVGDALEALGAGALSGEGVRAIVVDQAQLIDASPGLDRVEKVLDYLPADTQRIMSALPMTPAVSDFAARHFKRTVTVPPTDGGDGPSRGEVRFRITAEPRDAGTLRVVEDVLGEGARHVLVFSRTEDRAADLGDYLTLHGYGAGAPGDPDAPVWLGVDALEAREAVGDAAGVVVVSADVPADPDTLDRRHAISAGGVAVVLPREAQHLTRRGRPTAYGTGP